MPRLIFYLVLSLLPATTAQSQSGIWERHTIDDSMMGADGVRLADVNGDGLMDIATGWEESGNTKVYLNPGHQRAGEKWPGVIAGRTPSVEDAVFADLNGDGIAEVISCTEGNSRRIFILRAPPGPGDYLDPEKWTCRVLPASDNQLQWMFAVPLQVDGLHGQDIIAGAKGPGAEIGWFQAPEDPDNLADWIWHPVSPATWTMSLIIRDMDHDGDPDIVLSDRKPGQTNGVRWLENPGSIDEQRKPWPNHFIGCEGLEVMFMDMADLDGDGLEDAIVTEYSNQHIVFMKRLDNSGLKWKSFPIAIPEITGRAKAVKVGDIDGDGRPDLVHSTNTLGNDSKAGLFWLSFRNNPADAEWEWHKLSGTVGYKFDRIELIDLDGDGDLDVLTCEEDYGPESRGLGIVWYENPFL